MAHVTDGQIDTEIMRAYQKYYNNHSNSLECVWTIRAEQDMQIRLFIDEFLLGAPNDCTQNFVEVYAGTTAGAPMKR
jgi:hypothetical protein